MSKPTIVTNSLSSLTDLFCQVTNRPCSNLTLAWVSWVEDNKHMKRRLKISPKVRKGTKMWNRCKVTRVRRIKD